MSCESLCMIPCGQRALNKYQLLLPSVLLIWWATEGCPTEGCRVAGSTCSALSLDAELGHLEEPLGGGVQLWRRGFYDQVSCPAQVVIRAPPQRCGRPSQEAWMEVLGQGLRPHQRDYQPG